MITWRVSLFYRVSFGSIPPYGLSMYLKECLCSVSRHVWTGWSASMQSAGTTTELTTANNKRNGQRSDDMVPFLVCFPLLHLRRSSWVVLLHCIPCQVWPKSIQIAHYLRGHKIRIIKNKTLSEATGQSVDSIRQGCTWVVSQTLTWGFTFKKQCWDIQGENNRICREKVTNVILWIVSMLNESNSYCYLRYVDWL